ncbi:protein translocase subunit SecF [Candidatus Dependentiae bacterium]|nr:protein translocase subunit SecF [Candidatus Dependentiae bacterium]
MIDFLKYRFLYALLSAAIIVSFVGVAAYKKMTTGQIFNYSVEFTGGTQLLLGFEKPMKSSEVVEILEHQGWSGITTREFSDKEILIRTKDVPEDIAILGEKVRQTIQEKLSDNTVKVLQIDSIGEGIGKALSWNSMKAVIFGLILMLIYIAWRFWSVAYGAGAVVSLFHDAIVILLFFLITGKEISMNVIGAIMAVLGYSINDTIVIFARIRDNIKHMRTGSIEHIVNVSINQTLRRTILTTGATTLVVIALLLFGGEALRDLSLALLIGIVFGAYSTIYIANPVMLLLYKETK